LVEPANQSPDDSMTRLPDAVQRRHVVSAALILAAALGLLRIAPGLGGRAGHLPTRLSDTAFWQLVSDLSEPGGSFISTNYVSNESTFQHVIPELKRNTRRGGVYLGVGPDQNFTYIAALEPRIAFIIDIRRQNMLLHLMYKALIELSSGRAEFLSRLFSRPRPLAAGAGDASTTRTLLEAYAAAAPDDAMFERNVRAVTDHLVNRHGFALSSSDLAAIKDVQRAFFEAGPDLRYAYPHRWFPSFADLVLETDDRGELHSYLSTEETFRQLKRLETNNLVVPVVGDFAGSKAIRAVGRYLKAHGASVSVFYTSNVEFYLFENARWKNFFTNVAGLPLDRNSVFVRAYFDAGSQAPSVPGNRSTTELDHIRAAIGAYDDGRIRSYADVIHRSDGSRLSH
jgi:hypothetical protein